MRAPERLAQLVLVVSLVLATGTPLSWALTRPPRDAGVVPVAAAPAGPQPVAAVVRDGSAEPPSDSVATTSGEPSAAAREYDTARGASDVAADDAATASAVPRPVARAARIGDLDQTPAAVPERLRIPALDIAAPVVGVGVDGDGEMEVPDDVDDVGWYRHGPAPGEPGAAVIAGHVDSREQGPGAFFDLRRLDVGARVLVTDSAGDVQRYEVVARRTYDKASLPADELFTRTGPSQLVLITCGGDFDPDERSYRDNVVIYAEPS